MCYVQLLVVLDISDVFYNVFRYGVDYVEVFGYGQRKEVRYKFFIFLVLSFWF